MAVCFNRSSKIDYLRTEACIYENAETAAKAREIAEKLGGPVVLKAQIHAGGRGKGGGIKVAKTPEEAQSLAEKMIGMTLVTHQTGPEGKKVKRLLVEEALGVAKELYLGIVIDRAKECPVVMASTEGGVEIEKVAAEHPELIFKEWIDPSVGLAGFQARKLAFKLGLGGETFKQAVKFLISLYRAFQTSDASLAEINPLIITTQTITPSRGTRISSRSATSTRKNPSRSRPPSTTSITSSSTATSAAWSTARD